VNLDFGFFNWQIVQSFILKGLAFSVQLTLVAMVGGIALGTVLALMRLSGKPWLVMPAAAYVNVLRSIPLVMVILWFFLLIPLLLGRPLGAEVSAIITFTVFEAAYYSEIMRAGIQSVPKGQVAAGYAVGMTYAQCMKLIVLPQAFRNMLPVLLTQTIILFQDTSLVYVISATDFVGAASKIAQRDGRLVEMYLTVGLIYFIFCFLASQLVKQLQGRLSYGAR
jgi:glutamate/aspartate transport system permease protein